MNDKKRKSLSDTELSVLKALWDIGPSPVRGILAALSARGWAYTTAKTLLARLEEKGYITRDRSREPHVFHAAFGRDELLRQEITLLLRRLCDDDRTPLLRALVRPDVLSRKDLRVLREHLDNLFGDED